MKIVPYRVLFEVDLDSATGKYRYSKPTNDMLPVDMSTDGTAYCTLGAHYEISTHDRGSRNSPGPYYQIAFRIEDPAPYDINEISLRLDPSLFRDADEEIDNDLYCDPNTRCDPMRNLWYQRSRYEKDSNGNWRIISENKKRSLTVDSITTAGVFRILPFRYGRVITDVVSPWIYVLPSCFSKDDYIAMLNDLINIHERLVTNQRSTVGIGKKTYIERETSKIKDEIESTKQLESAIKCIMASPAEQQGKRYKRMPIMKISHFDAHVVQNYISSGMKGKVLGIEYFEDHDTYENRLIKYILKRIAQRRKQKYIPSIDPNTDIEKEAAAELKRITDMRMVTQEGIKQSARTFYFTGHPPKEGYHKLLVHISGNIVEFKDHAPFQEGDKNYIRAKYIAHSRREMIFYLNHLTTFCNSIGEWPRPQFNICCSFVSNKKPYTTTWNNTVYDLSFSYLLSINGDDFDQNRLDISEQEYQRLLIPIIQNNGFSIDENRSFFLYPEETNRIIKQDSKERELMLRDITASLSRKVNNEKARRELYEVEERLIELLNAPWFNGISDYHGPLEVKPTPKFRKNMYYAIIYKLISEKMQAHPLLAGNFDVNAFGVISTQLVYEYWVLYKILYQLQTLGFSLANTDELTNDFRKFIQGKQLQRKSEKKQTSTKYSGYVVNAYRDNGSHPIKLRIGYDENFITTKIPGIDRLQRRPDFSLCIESMEGRHWYFLDAKYKSFSIEDKTKVNYEQEVYDVSIEKYILDIGKIFQAEDDFKNDQIRGSYIVMANVLESAPNLSENNRLFGGPKSILTSDKIQKNNDEITTDLIDLGSKSTPAHRYGAIVLSPAHDSELLSLFQLIFEYLETNKSDIHENLSYCWCCNTKTPVIRERKETNRSTEEQKYYKYYITCNECKSFRVDNHCISCGKAIIKHTSGNFHKWDDSVQNSQWAFLCPDCGSPVNGFSEFDLESLTAEETDRNIQDEEEVFPF